MEDMENGVKVFFLAFLLSRIVLIKRCTPILQFLASQQVCRHQRSNKTAPRKMENQIIFYHTQLPQR